MLIYHCQCYRTLCNYSSHVVPIFYSYIAYLFAFWSVRNKRTHSHSFVHDIPPTFALYNSHESVFLTLGHEFSTAATINEMYSSDIAHTTRTQQEQEKERSDPFHRVHDLPVWCGWFLFCYDIRTHAHTHTLAHNFGFINSTWALESQHFILSQPFALVVYSQCYSEVVQTHLFFDDFSVNQQVSCAPIYVQLKCIGHSETERN